MHFIKRSLLPVTILTLSVLSPSISMAEGNVISIQETFEEAMKYRKEGKLQESIAKFKSILAENPDKSRVRLELATAFYRAGDYASAEEQINKVLADTSIPDSVRQNSQRFLQQVQRKMPKNKVAVSRHKVKGKVSLSFGDDSNANVAPEDTSLDVGTLPSSMLSKQDNYLTSSAQISHQYLLTKPTAKTKSIYYWTNGLSALSRNYADVHDSDLQVISAYTGLHMRTPLNWRNDVKLKVDYIRVGNDPLAYYFSVLPRTTYVFKKISFSLAPSYTYRDYIDDKDKGSEGEQLGLELSTILPLSDSSLIRLSADVRDTSLNDEYRSYQGYRLTALFNKEFSNKVSVNLLGEYENNEYDAPERLYKDNREDDIIKMSAGIQYQITKNIPIGLKYTHIERDSNHDIHSYSRDRVEASISYKF